MDTATKIGLGKVLYATDLSDESAQAASYVRGLQQAYQAEVSVVHVLDVFPHSVNPDAADTRRIAEIRERGNTRVHQFMLARGFREGEFKPVVLTGEVSVAIDQFASEEQMDLILLGSHGRLGIDRLFLGSMAEEIFRTARCPVMVVGPEARPSNRSFSRLLFSTDLSPIAQAALPYIEFMLRENGEARVSLAHFVEQSPGTPYELHKTRRRLGEALTNLVDPSLRGRIDDVAVEFSAPAEGMISMARGVGAELLFLAVRQGGAWTRASTHGLASITHQVISRLPCPVFTVRGS